MDFLEEKSLVEFLKKNLPDGGFLESHLWKKFQQAWGRRCLTFFEKNKENNELLLFANVIEHSLPLVGKYWYVPRGPVADNFFLKEAVSKKVVGDFLAQIINKANEEKIGWIRIEPSSEKILNFLTREIFKIGKEIKIVKSTVDVQPKEIFVINIEKNEADLLADMKQKTRYNLRLAQKKKVEIVISREKKYIDNFIRLVKVTAERDKITAHPESYYQKMLEVIGQNNLKLYSAICNKKIIAANLIYYFGDTATYLHGASDNIYRNVMAPYLLQWRAILDAKKAGLKRYDFGGVKTRINEQESKNNDWKGITKFKTGFSKSTKAIVLPGCYDIVLRRQKHLSYRVLQKIKKILNFKKR